MWNLVFLFSNLALFLLLPFSHLFIESEGFPGSKKGVKARVYESCLVLALVCILLLGITYIISSLFNDSHNSIASILSMERRCILNSWSKEEVRAVVRYEWGCGVSGTEIHNRLVEVYGPGVMSKQMVWRWCRTFSDGRQQVEDIPRAGRTRTAVSTTYPKYSYLQP
ncbi:HTH_48 domain-containing protein [Trichonephila clavata]|uniref:HTH_48 domain-containing protein n=1 Tax=Trichonephila clavata TaxID=2740835 RepID=A0A8X6HLY3_TRICU|nr:HTH_48 domain-containing protein [Trichonephila clavata]